MKKVPFYANTPDDTHCLQASLKMVLKYFLPDKDYSWKQLEKMTAKAPGKATWPQKMLLSLNDMGFETVMIEAFDGKAFIKDGGKYLQRTFGKQTADWQIANSDIAGEQKLYSQLLNTDAKIENRIPVLGDIKKYLKAGYLVICVVNSKRLNHKRGYAGHFVVVLAIGSSNIIIHDPGLPATENRVEPIDNFEAAWANPNDHAKSLIAIKYEEQ